VRSEDGTTRDITGRTFGLLTVVSRAPNDKFGGKVFLLPSEKQRMKELHQLGGLSHPDLAAQFHVSLITVRRTLRGASSRR